MGHKVLWWECAQIPEVQIEGSESGANATRKDFEQQVRELTVQSLSLLRAAMPDEVCTDYPALLSLEVWASIMGMFEQNNLSIMVWRCEGCKSIPT
jgi:hypothetical protein